MDPDVDKALEAMTAPELRSLVRSVLDGLEDADRARVTNSLVARAARGHDGSSPSRPSTRIVDEAKSFADAARQLGYADPADVSDHLRQATRTFLAGDHASARAAFEAILPMIAIGDVDLGQHELVADVLSVDVHACVAQYVTTVYTTTGLSERAKAVYDAIERVESVSSLWNPIQDMENVSAGSLPDLGAFLPQWVKRLARNRPPKDDWEGAPERWLREAVFRAEGVDGLERIALKTRRPQACLAWCEALVARADWAAALRAYDTAARLVTKTPWRGQLLDGAAHAAGQLRRADVAKRLEKAWRTAPTLTRLLRWLAVGDSGMPTLRAKAKRARTDRPQTAGRQLALLHVLTDDIQSAARLLSKAPGLGWSNADHPGHFLFPLFAVLLAGGTSRKVSATLLENLESTGRDPLETLAADDAGERPKLSTPSMVALIQDLRPSIKIDVRDREAMLDGMRIAAEKRVEGILSHSRRRHYDHAATLVASCLALAPSDAEEKFSAWIAGLRRTYSRRSAFKNELTHAMGSLGVSVIE